MGFRVGVTIFAAALAADLATKEWAVATRLHSVYFNTPRQGLLFRVVMCTVALSFIVLATRVAAWRRLGRPWGAWIGGALLVAGVLGNGVSPLLWTKGVPDFIVTGDWIGNLADFEIFFGITGGFFALALGVVLLYGREKLAARRAS